MRIDDAVPGMAGWDIPSRIPLLATVEAHRLDLTMGASYVSGNNAENGDLLPHQVDPKNSSKSLKYLLQWAMRKVNYNQPAQTERLIEELWAQICAYGDIRISHHAEEQREKAREVAKQQDWFNSTDAMVWAIKFSEMVKAYPADEGFEANDVGTLVGWFANAMAVGENVAYKRGERDALSKYEGQLKDMATKIIEQRQTVASQAETIDGYRSMMRRHVEDMDKLKHLIGKLESENAAKIRTIANLQQLVDSNGSPAHPLSKLHQSFRACTARYALNNGEQVQCAFSEGHDRVQLSDSHNRTGFGHGNEEEGVWWDDDYTNAIPAKSHKPLSSIDVTGQEITPGQLNVMTPPRDAAYGKPVVDEPDGYDDSILDLFDTPDNIQYFGEGKLTISGNTIETSLPPLICKDGVHYVGDVLPQVLGHDGCRFTGVKRTAIKDNPQA